MARRATIVVHGIGQAQPYQIARAFAEGLCRIALKRNEGTPAVVQVITRTPQQLGVQGPPGRVYRFTSSVADEAFIDVYEAYWAPLTTGMTSFLGILWWLVINTFIPTRLLKRPSLKTVYDVVFTGLFLAIVAGLYYGLFGALLLTTQDVLRELDGKVHPVPLIHPLPSLSSVLEMSLRTVGHLLRDSWGAPAHVALDKASVGALGSVFAPVTLGWLIATVVGVYSLFQFLFRLSELAGDLLNLGGGRAVLFQSPWRPLAHLGVLGAWGCLSLVARGYVTSAFFAFGYIYVVFQLANLWIKKYFVDYIGDIEVYVTRDSKNARFLVRDQIRSRAVDAIRAALVSPENYDEVLVFGHSLGSVIGLDAIRELRRDLGETVTPAQFNRLSSFVTFGSPLEKTRFFFERVSPDDPGPWRDFLNEVEGTFLQDAETRRIYWTNFWYFADVVGNSLESYNDNVPDLVRTYELSRRGARIWVHSDYVIDDYFLAPVYRRLTQGPPREFPSYVMGNSETIVVR